MRRIRAALVEADESGSAELPFLHNPLHVQSPEPLASYQREGRRRRPARPNGKMHRDT
jgi:hypothetical protein